MVPSTTPASASAFRLAADPGRRERYEMQTAVRKAALRVEVDRLLAQLAPLKSLVLEVGCGHGHFLTSYAAAHPGEGCMGVDFCKDRIARAGRKLARLGLSNLGFVRAEAGEFLDVLPGTVRFDRVFLLFPDPWPKKRHHKHRLTSPTYLERLARVAASEAELYFRTDDVAFFADTLAVLTESASWRQAHELAWPFEHATVFQEKADTHHSLCAVRKA